MRAGMDNKHITKETMDFQNKLTDKLLKVCDGPAEFERKTKLSVNIYYKMIKRTGIINIRSLISICKAYKIGVDDIIGI